MEKLCLGIWKHPDHRIFRLSWRLSKESSCVEYGMHGKVRVIRGGIKVLECLANFPSDVQALRTFFLDFSHQGLLGRLTGFDTPSGQEEVPAIAYRSNPTIAIWYHSVDSSPGMIRVSVYLGTEDVLYLSHDG
jgi:hypothetical protein